MPQQIPRLRLSVSVWWKVYAAFGRSNVWAVGARQSINQVLESSSHCGSSIMTLKRSIHSHPPIPNGPMATENHRSFDLIDSHFWPANYKYFKVFHCYSYIQKGLLEKVWILVFRFKLIYIFRLVDIDYDTIEQYWNRLKEEKLNL